MVALTSCWFFFLCSLFLPGAFMVGRVQDTCEEVELPPGGQTDYVYWYLNATTRTDVQQGPQCSTDSLLGPGQWAGLDGDGLNWRVVMSQMGDAETEAIVLEGDCNDLRCVASSNDSDQQGNNQVVWETQNGTNYYIFTSGTSDTEDRFNFHVSVEPADSLSKCKYLASAAIGGGEFGTQCICDESSLTLSCYDTCDTCFGSSCGKYFTVNVYDPDIDEPDVSDQACFYMEGGRVFCYIYSTTMSTCDITVDWVSCSSCKVCGDPLLQVCADCTNIQPGAIINEVEGTGLVGIFSEPLAKELYNNFENAVDWELGSCISSTKSPTPAPVVASTPPTEAPTPAPTPAPSAAAAALISAWNRAMWIAVSFQIIASSF